MPTTHRSGIHQVSLPRALSKLGVASRSQAMLLVKEGKVSVNGSVVASPDIWVDLRSDRIEVDGKPAMKRSFVYLALNKPAGFVTTRSDERGRKTVYDLLPSDYQLLFPVGRLDKESSGLLLFTNDTQFGEMITSPESKLPKRYAVGLNEGLRKEHAQIMRAGMKLDDGTALMSAEILIQSSDPACCEVTIREGKNRQIRRMFETLGYDVVVLKRLSVGSVELGTLREGQTRVLTNEELSQLTKIKKKSTRTQKGRGH